MTELTSRERLTRLFRGEDIDRIPVWLLFPWFPSPAYANVLEEPSYRPVLAKVRAHSEFIDRRPFDTGFCFSAHPDIRREKRVYRDGGMNVSQTVISCGEVTLKSAVGRGPDGSWVESFVKEPSDLDAVLRLPYRPPRPALDWFFAERDALGSGGLMGVDIADPLSVLHGLCSETDFALFIHTEAGKVREFLEVMGERVLDAYRYLLENGVGEVYWISGAEFATPPMVHPANFGDLAVKYTRRLCEMIRSYGAVSMIHCHGRVGKLLGGLAEIGADAHHPIEAPPMGDCTLSQAREAFGKDIVLAGNIQLGDLWEKREEEMEAMVKAVIDEGRAGRFILSTTGGPSAATINDRVVNNYHRIIETALAYGR